MNPPAAMTNSEPLNGNSTRRRKGAKTSGFWTAVAERSGDTAFRLLAAFSKRRCAALPAALQKSFVQLGLATLLPCAIAGRARAEDHVDYRYEFYKEEGGRIEVETHSALFEKKLTDIVTVKGQVVYDAISGATPNGLPPPPGSKQVMMQKLHDALSSGASDTGALARSLSTLGEHTIKVADAATPDAQDKLRQLGQALSSAAGQLKG